MTNATNHTDLFSKTIAISIAFEGIGSSRKVSLDNVEVDAEKDRLRLASKILACPERAAIDNLFGTVRAEVAGAKRGLVLPTLFKRGVYLVPVASVEKIEEMMQGYQVRLAALVEDLIKVYPKRIEEDRQNLRDKFNIAHYPSVSGLRQSFRISWRYLTLQPASQLQSISSAVYAKEVARVKAEVQELGEEIKSTMRGAALELVSHMSERLSGTDEKGKPKIFRDSMVSNLVDFLTSFDAKNVMGDDELSGVLAQMKDILSNVTPKDLRTNEALRNATAANVAQIKNQLEALVVPMERSVVLS
jgi:hypothetical protein